MINLACGYVYGLLHGIAVTVITATIGVIIAHIVCKVTIRIKPIKLIHKFSASMSSQATSSRCSSRLSMSGPC